MKCHEIPSCHIFCHQTVPEKRLHGLLFEGCGGDDTVCLCADKPVDPGQGGAACYLVRTVTVVGVKG